MKASVVDLRYRMSEVLEALERREKVSILYHGKVKGTIVPYTGESLRKISEHPFFGMAASDPESVDEVMKRLRQGRFDAL